jgi:hypothetical protein
MSSYTLTVQEDTVTGEFFLQFTDEMLAEVGWQMGDTITWTDLKDGTWSLTKKEKKMPKFTLIAEHQNYTTGATDSKVTHEFECEYLPDVLENVQMFLKGTGFVFDGQLDIFEEEDDEVYGLTPEGQALWESYETFATPEPEHTKQYFDTERNK